LAGDILTKVALYFFIDSVAGIDNILS